MAVFVHIVLYIYGSQKDRILFPPGSLINIKHFLIVPELCPYSNVQKIYRGPQNTLPYIFLTIDLKIWKIWKYSPNWKWLYFLRSLCVYFVSLLWANLPHFLKFFPNINGFFLKRLLSNIFTLKDTVGPKILLTPHPFIYGFC